MPISKGNMIGRRERVSHIRPPTATMASTNWKSWLGVIRRNLRPSCPHAARAFATWGSVEPFEAGCAGTVLFDTMLVSRSNELNVSYEACMRIFQRMLKDG